MSCEHGVFFRQSGHDKPWEKLGTEQALPWKDVVLPILQVLLPLIFPYYNVVANYNTKFPFSFSTVQPLRILPAELLEP